MAKRSYISVLIGCILCSLALFVFSYNKDVKILSSTVPANDHRTRFKPKIDETWQGEAQKGLALPP